MSAFAFSESTFKKKLAELNPSQQSIQGLSAWLITQRKHVQAVTQIWYKEFLCAPEHRKLTFVYLANDVIQNSRKKYSEYGKEFAPILSHVMHHMAKISGDKTRKSILRILSIWQERGVYDSKLMQDFQTAYLMSSSSSSAPTVTYSPNNNLMMDSASSLHDVAMSEAKLRQDILLREKELAELRKRKVELQVKAAQAQLEVYHESGLYPSEQLDVVLEQQKLSLPAILPRPHQMESASLENLTVSSASSSPPQQQLQSQSVRPLHAVAPQTNLQSPKSNYNKVVNDGHTGLEDKENKPGEEKNVEKENETLNAVSKLIYWGAISSPSSEGSNSNDMMECIKNRSDEQEAVQKTEETLASVIVKASKSTRSAVVYPPVEVVDMGFENIKDRRDKLVVQLFTGMRCTSCGLRFHFNQRDKYSEHLDWHFRKNRRKRSRTTKIRSRKWYYSLSDWFQYIESEDSDERAPSILCESHDLTHNAEEVGIQSKRRKLRKNSEHTMSASGRDGTTSCPHCNETFYMFYDHEKEEWRFKNACQGIDEDGVEQLFHAECLQDYLSCIEETLPIPSLTSTTNDVNHGESSLVKEVKMDQDSPAVESTTIEMCDEHTIDKDSKEDVDIICIGSPSLVVTKSNEIEIETGEKVRSTDDLSHPSLPPLRVHIQEAAVVKRTEHTSDPINHDDIAQDDYKDVIVQERKLIIPKPRLDHNQLRNCPPKISGKETSGLCTIC